MVSKSSMAFAVLTALVFRLCCIVPFVVIVTGLTGGATMFSFLEPWRPLLLTVSVSILAWGFYQEYKPKNLDKMRPCCRERAEKKSRRNKRFLWIATIVSILLFTFPLYSHVFINSTSAQTSNTQTTKTIQLCVEGMACQGCANNIMLKLARTKGILKDTVVFVTKAGTVTFDERIISSQQIIKTINDIGFRATIKK